MGNLGGGLDVLENINYTQLYQGSQFLHPVKHKHQLSVEHT